ncbi:hypothetical protein L1987_05186 [Smallanthus sonchifolius]|uniref:Uncharacterized protein n=1 Tax=Smallanthus sonchifolius TaxID=185202 RepID=A0ACB9JUU0_9ASTR|nr:hypothetical protein L1987_05186 [Smallanthus sonchifolius]
MILISKLQVDMPLVPPVSSWNFALTSAPRSGAQPLFEYGGYVTQLRMLAVILKHTIWTAATSIWKWLSSATFSELMFLKEGHSR